MSAGTVHIGTGVGAGVGVGGGVMLGAGVGEGDGEGVAVGSADDTGIPAITPLRIGNDADELTEIGVPMRLLITGVINENRHVIATIAGEPMSVPFGKVGAGRVAGIVQLIPDDSAPISRTYSGCDAAVAGVPQAVGYKAA
jgi:hypothetical protein